jgi:uncharacterized membrane protein YhaH (DUF805 family)
MTFADAVKSGLKNYNRFKGTATRAEFWYFYLFNVLLNVVTSTLDRFITPGDASGLSSAGLLYTITGLLLVLPNLTITVRRFHDAGLSGKWLFLWLLPVVAFFIGGGFAFAQNQNLNLATATNEQILNAVLPLVPSLLLAAAIGVFQLVIELKATKSTPNKYANQIEASTSASE